MRSLTTTGTPSELSKARWGLAALACAELREIERELADRREVAGKQLASVRPSL